jgi:hypothetical protein
VDSTAVQTLLPASHTHLSEVPGDDEIAYSTCILPADDSSGMQKLLAACEHLLCSNTMCCPLDAPSDSHAILAHACMLLPYSTLVHTRCYGVR